MMIGFFKCVLSHINSVCLDVVLTLEMSSRCAVYDAQHIAELAFYWFRTSNTKLSRNKSNTLPYWFLPFYSFHSFIYIYVNQRCLSSARRRLVLFDQYIKIQRTNAGPRLDWSCVRRANSGDVETTEALGLVPFYTKLYRKFAYWCLQRAKSAWCVCSRDDDATRRQGPSRAREN